MAPTSSRAALELSTGGTEVVSATFTVANQVPALAWNPGGPVSLTSRGREHLEPGNAQRHQRGGRLTLTETASWLTVSPTTGSTPAAVTLTINTAGLAPGTYTTVVSASAPGYVSDDLSVTLTAGDPNECQPVVCSQILVSLPYELEFDQDHGKIRDSAGIGTGFTYLDWPSRGVGYIPPSSRSRPVAGTLQITTTSGLFAREVNTQDNALGVGIDAPSQSACSRPP